MFGRYHSVAPAVSWAMFGRYHSVAPAVSWTVFGRYHSVAPAVSWAVFGRYHSVAPAVSWAVFGRYHSVAPALHIRLRVFEFQEHSYVAVSPFRRFCVVDVFGLLELILFSRTQTSIASPIIILLINIVIKNALLN